MIERCIASGWSSGAISLYMANRFGYQLDDSTIRRHKSEYWNEIAAKYPDLVHQGEQRVFVEQHIEKDEFVDHVGLLGSTIRLQRERIEMDLRLEQQFAKLMPAMRLEIELLSKLLMNYHEVLQDFGVVPKAGENVNVNLGPSWSSQPSVPLIDLFDDETKLKMIENARLINEHAPRQLDAPD